MLSSCGFNKESSASNADILDSPPSTSSEFIDSYNDLSGITKEEKIGDLKDSTASALGSYQYFNFSDSTEITFHSKNKKLFEISLMTNNVLSSSKVASPNFQRELQTVIICLSPKQNSTDIMKKLNVFETPYLDLYDANYKNIRYTYSIYTGSENDNLALLIAYIS